MPLYVLTAANGINGAACMLYPGVIAGFAEERRKDIIILPSSVHEVLLLEGTKGGADGLSQLVAFVNMYKVPKEDILSYSVYQYSLEKEEIRLIV